MLASAAADQATAHGDGAGLLLLLTASLLTQARDLLALGVDGAEIQAGYRLSCGMALALLEQEVCGRLGEPRDELQVGAVLRPFLCAWQPGFDVWLEVVAARCCVYSWTPVTSGERGEVWEGVTFDPSTLRVCTVLDDSHDVATWEMQDDEEGEEEEEEEEEEERAGQDDYTEFRGEEQPEVENEIDKMGEEVSQQTQIPETDGEQITEPRWEKEKQATDRETRSKKKNQYDRDSAGQEEGDTPSQLENRKMTRREGEEEDDEAVETEAFDDWVDLGVEIWGTVCDSARDNGVVWSEDTTQQERLRDVTRLEAACRNPLSINMHSSTKTKETMRCLTNENTMHKHITSAHSAHYKRKINRPRGKLSKAARQKPSSTTLDGQSPRKACPTRRHSHASSDLPGFHLPLRASVVVEEPQDGDACSRVRVTLCSPDPTLLVSAQGAVHACLRVYQSLLAEPRLVAGAGAAELALAVGLTQQGLGLVGMEQLVVHAFAQALLEPAKVLGENSGTPGDLAVLRLYRSHRETNKEGVHSWETSAPTMLHQGMEQAVLDPLRCKASAIQKATEATLKVLTELSSAGDYKMDDSSLIIHTKQSE